MPNDPWAPSSILLTCEHGGNEVPIAYAGFFRSAADTLVTHRGYDIGALGVALRMAATIPAPLVFSTTTRLLIDLNRSLDNPGLFSEFSRDLPAPEREELIATHYEPHRRAITSLIGDQINAGQRVLHVGVHSCADVLAGEKRELDIALLFDPARPSEASVCERWRHALETRRPEYRYPFNKPYLGTDDGLVTTLRSLFPASSYAGIEIELRQGLLKDTTAQCGFADLLTQSLRDACPSLSHHRA